MLATLQQKDISGIMTNLWQSDRSKAKWAILAKAYTLIRDKKGKANAPLDSFLNLNAPLIGIPKPDEYMNKLGWEIIISSNGEAKLRRNTDNDAAESAAGAMSNASVQDIIAHSYEHGYINAQDGDIVKMPENEAVLSMTTSGNAVPPVSSATQVEGTNINAGTSNQGSNVTPNGVAQPSPGQNPPGQNPPGQNPPGQTPPGQNPPENDAAMAGDNMDLAFYSPAALDFMLNAIRDANPPNLQPFTESQIDEEFIPGHATLFFDPYAIDEHDAFDMGEFMEAPVEDFDINQWIEFDIPES